jgi:hypothetical protein
MNTGSTLLLPPFAIMKRTISVTALLSNLEWKKHGEDYRLVGSRDLSCWWVADQYCYKSIELPIESNIWVARIVVWRKDSLCE